MDYEKLFIQKIIVHILDNNVGMPVLSEAEVDLNKDILGFIEKHIDKLLNDPSLKEACFLGEDNYLKNLCQELQNNNASFINTSKTFAAKIYEQFSVYKNIPSGDLICCLFEINDEKCFAVMKLNYKESYIHQVTNLEGGTFNNIIKQKTTLPNENQKVEEGILIYLSDDYKIKLLEKKFDIDNTKDFYLSTKVLNCTSELSSKEKIKILEKTAKKITEKFFDENDINKFMDFKKIVHEDIENNMNVSVHKVADVISGNIPEIKEEYIKEVENKGINEKEIIVNSEKLMQSYKKQKIITDTGIELNIPVDDFKNKEKIEFINNQDGTISVVLKNIKNLK